VSLVDSHCHLDASQFDADREAVIARAVESGVVRIVNPGVDLPSSRMAVDLARRHERIYAAIGIHPHEAKVWDAATLDELKKLATSPKVVAIGEIGLDYYRDLSPRDVQRRAFESQLELAAELGLPIIVHDRDAHEDVLAALDSWRSSLHMHPGVLHSFSGDVALARRALELEFCIGVSGPVTYKNADRLHEVVRAVPMERLLIETDAPYLAPHPHRGHRNEPAYIRFVAEAVAAIRGMTVDQVAARTSANARALFGWSDVDHG
jgi:TatD DNase family protein